MLDRSKFLPLVEKFFNTHAGLLLDMDNSWPEDGWYTVSDDDGTQYDINLWTDDTEFRAAIYPVVDGCTLGSVYVKLDVPYYLLKAKYAQAQGVVLTQAQEIIDQHNLLRLAHEYLLDIVSRYEDADALEIMSIIETEVYI